MQKLNLPDGLYMRPACGSDKGFIETLYKTTRDDLRMIDAEDDYIEELIDMQHQAQTIGYGDKFPNAMYFIVEKHNESVGRVVVDFGPNEIRVVDIALIPKARGKGFGKGVIQSIQMAATSTRVPLLLAVEHANLSARQLYASLGFQLEERSDLHDLLIWYPTNTIAK